MNITEIKTSKFYGFGVLVPEDAQDFTLEISLDNDFCQLEYLLENTDVDSGFCGDWVTHSIDLPTFDYKIIGIKTEITEEQAKDIVDELAELIFKDYMPQTNGLGMSYFDTALESFNSLMQKLEMYSENPYGEKPVCDCNYSCGEADRYNCGMEHHLLEQAQQRTGKWLIIQKIK